jgi:hypothetical protein
MLFSSLLIYALVFLSVTLKISSCGGWQMRGNASKMVKICPLADSRDNVYPRQGESRDKKRLEIPE